ncbi:DUF1616 domain-containing protein [Haloarcula argentinensis]|uniref:DUF1616 domain-containing protein n=1 Tax=Haloarcula argentinensis TaxID=43776 RepID=A0ABU2F4F3_HALAR|nr:DUF1616 domain-containing protein [Haloarcula argentinensis]EMA26532.1 hypothetical protein C443_02262 [Haloarcula argentinensis DSM 12282]MDS0255372.1 DUF1616 domain-containing protein [Haloarcula argentinensis]
MGRWSDALPATVDLLAAVGYTAVVLLATLSSLDGVSLAAIALPFLLFVPGYAVVASLFPTRNPEYENHRLITTERILYSVVASICLAIIVGVNLEFTPWPIRPTPVVTTLAIVTVVAAVIAWYRRRQRTPTGLGQPSMPFGNSRAASGSSDGEGIQLGTIVVGVAILVTFASVMLVAAQPQRGEAYTEFGLLTQNETGDLEAGGYPEQITMGESEQMYFTVTNHEMETTEYVVVVQLARTAPTGEVIERTRLDSYNNRTAAGDRWLQRHTVTPVLEGERLRLTYLLYRGRLPDQPTTENAYRETHIWVDIT